MIIIITDHDLIIIIMDHVLIIIISDHNLTIIVIDRDLNIIIIIIRAQPFLYKAQQGYSFGYKEDVCLTILMMS